MEHIKYFMSIQNITKHSFQDTFSVSLVQFEKACTIDHAVQQNAYAIYWIQERKSRY
jgi:AraC family transcriptional activator of pobA